MPQPATTESATTGRATTESATTGSATTGSATTVSVTTGSATTGSNATGSATTESATTGCATTESATTSCTTTRSTTTKSATTGSNTTENATTKSTTAGSSTTGSTTTGSTTTKSTTAGSSTTGSTTTKSTTTGSTSNCISEPEPDPEQYIEDACVVLLSFGMWKEEVCNKRLPFICYDERFFGQIYVSDVNTSAANLSWTEGPGAENISHYRVEITKHQPFNQTFNQTFNQIFNQTDLFEHIQNLTAGTLYTVQVFPVKCGRDLNPQNISFYTQPSDVQNLTVVNVTSVSVNLKWSKPEGNRHFYSVTFRNESKPVEQKCDSEECNITGLIPGTEYKFTVKAVVNKTFEGVGSNISDYTTPSTVRNLRSADNQSFVITVLWDPPEGGHSGYRYCLTEVNHDYNCTDCSFATSSSSTTNFITTTSSSSTTNNNIVDCNTTADELIRKSNVSDGSKFCLCVAALTKNGELSGKMVAIPAYTLPKSVILSLSPGYQNMTANWTIVGKYEKFSVTITTDAYTYTFSENVTFLNYTFQSLKAGVYYTVSVVTINGNLRSHPTNKSDYTRPKSPGNPDAKAKKTTINVKWAPPSESADALIRYMVEYRTEFWDQSTTNYTTETQITYPNLKPGTKYTFKIRVVAGNLTSDDVNTTAKTEPNRRTLVLTMLCSSTTPLHCDKNETRKELIEKLQNKMNDKFQDQVHWKLRWAPNRNDVP
ncbi:receptor-type tyrosine-protein phosphatase eta-like [Labeo rohita]|uniref:receptor-type tyrosine-protein phosphatase eta-like n=1 Tax=Labeo rohita TaxID=84645 RepID=UPI0021E23908|nr:receptor-type tyrosine-protein phosphatase eta-like [Labeo rohita]